MLAQNCLVWDGAAFGAVPHYRPILPNGAQLLPGGEARITPKANANYVRAMTINPRISAFLAGGLMRYGYLTSDGEWLYQIMLENKPDFAGAYEPKFQEFYGLGLAFASKGLKNTIFVKITSDETEVLKTLYHELFHTIYGNIPGSQVDRLVDFGNAIRSANLEAGVFHPDSRGIGWIKESEEAEAYAFERYAVKEPMPFGLELPRRVRSTFDAVLRGDFAHHMLDSRARDDRAARGRE